MVVITDVTSPLLGEEGAVAVFGAQKGISAADRSAYECRLAGFAGKITHASPDISGAGAAGGPALAFTPGARSWFPALGRLPRLFR
ncbi:glycerate kinase [Pseudarthrobacter cellobiosi]|uniref:glycerate kinase n=1 Tax=Pseudarthrobacter cellobiosi TaxID=2953654 RepID=UPI00208EC10F|nr:MULTISPECIES: glycerate kinase [unclassified Pseudarthrobacter]MCO4274606.1 glycerate kinase [Pseudarthrobacter sp. HLT3-5]